MVPFAVAQRARFFERAHALASPRACLRKWACPGGVRGGGWKVAMLPPGLLLKHLRLSLAGQCALLAFAGGVRRNCLLRWGARYEKDLARERVPGRLEGLGGVGEGEGPPRIEPAEGGFVRPGALVGP